VIKTTLSVRLYLVNSLDMARATRNTPTPAAAHRKLVPSGESNVVGFMLLPVKVIENEQGMPSIPAHIGCRVSPVDTNPARHFLNKLAPNNIVMIKSARKMKNRTFAIEAAPAAMPPNPNMAAIMAIIKKIIDQRNIRSLF
jgi:hypothetical protein